MVFLRLTKIYSDGTDEKKQVTFLNMAKIDEINYIDPNEPKKGSNLWYGKDEGVCVKESPMEILSALKKEIRDNNRIIPLNTGPRP